MLLHLWFPNIYAYLMAWWFEVSSIGETPTGKGLDNVPNKSKPRVCSCRCSFHMSFPPPHSPSCLALGTLHLRFHNVQWNNVDVASLSSKSHQRTSSKLQSHFSRLHAYGIFFPSFSSRCVLSCGLLMCRAINNYEARLSSSTKLCPYLCYTGPCQCCHIRLIHAIVIITVL